MKGLDTFTIDVSKKLSDADKAEIRKNVEEVFKTFIDNRVDDKMYDDREMSEDKAEESAKHDLFYDFDLWDKKVELTSVDKDDEPEQYNYEKELFLQLAKK